MSDKEKFQAEIDRLLDVIAEEKGDTPSMLIMASSQVKVLLDLKNFIASLPEEPISEDLNAEIQYLHSIHPEVPLSELTRLAIHAMRCKEQQTINKACDAYCQICGHYAHKTPHYVCRQNCEYFKEFKSKIEAIKN